MSRSVRVLLVPVGLLLVAGATIGGQRPTKRPDVTSHLSLMGFTLERSTLADVQNKLGATASGSCSTGEEASKMICYVSSAPDKTRVVFESGFSGGWSTLDGFKVVSVTLAEDCRFQCLRTPAFENGIKTNGGLRLGLTRQELLALLGPPTKVNGSRLTFEWQSQRPMTREEIDQETRTFNAPVTNPYFDVLDTVDVRLTNSSVTEFEIRRTTTY